MLFAFCKSLYICFPSFLNILVILNIILKIFEEKLSVDYNKLQIYLTARTGLLLAVHIAALSLLLNSLDCELDSVSLIHLVLVV